MFFKIFSKQLYHMKFSEPMTQKDTLDSIPDLIWVRNRDGIYLECNTAFAKLLDHARSDIIGKTDDDLTPPEWSDVDKAYDRKALDSDESITVEEKMVFPGAKGIRFYEIIKTLLKNEDGAVLGVLSVARDITQRKQMEDALSAEAQRSKMLMDISQDGIAVFDENHRVVKANKRFIDMLGYSPEEILKLHSWDFDAKFSEEEIRSGFAELSMPMNIIETQHRRKDGSVYDVEVSASGAQFDTGFLIVTISRDITDRKEKEKLTRKMNQTNKMEAVGQLAAGIAHDFNNILTGIIGAAKILARYLPDHPQAQKMHQVILDTTDKASSMISSLLAFSREGPISESLVDMHTVIQDTFTLLELSFDKRIVLEARLEAPSSSVVGDPSLLQNALLNLCINAGHAMPTGGTLTVTTSLQELDESYCKTSLFDIQPGVYLELEVRDTGRGIPKHLLLKIFEPFFTTKEPGEGTGLGLSSVFGIVQQHHGAIVAYSEVGEGTVFQILLPSKEKQLSIETPVSLVQKGNGTILIVDDDEAMRETATAILEDLGYKTILAQNGEEALQIYLGYGESIDLVLLDTVMPVMNGLDCFDELIKNDPDTCVVLSSGFALEEDVIKLKEKGLKGFLRKPYHISQMAQIIYEALQE